MKKILASIMTIGLVSAMLVSSTYSVFSDEETSAGNSFTAGTLDLKVDGKDDPNIAYLELTNMKPGDTTGYQVWCLKNTGSIPGQVQVEVGSVTNDDNGTNEPEDIAEAAIGTSDGELGQYLKRTVGWGPCSWSVPSQVLGDWSTGPQHPWGTPGLNGMAGKTFTYGSNLGPGEEIGFFFKLDLEEDLRRWDGTKWIDVDDNIIQSDKSLVDLLFQLEQV